MSRFPLIVALLLAAGLVAGAEPAPAKVVNTSGKERKEFQVYVTEEAIDTGLTYVDDPRAANPVKATLKPGQYEVEYRDTQHKDLLQGRSHLGRGAEGAEKALQSYTQAVATCRFDWEKQEAYLGLARAAELAKKYDAGVQAMAGFEKDFPKGVQLPEAVFQKGRLLALKGDQPGAIKTLEGLRARQKEWGVAAAVKGSLGIAEILARDGKQAEAATELAQWGGKIDAARHPAEFAAAMLGLAQAQAAAGQPAAVDTYKAVAYSPARPADQAAAHLGWARLLADKDPFSAFDHAAIAAALRDAEPAVRGEAHRLAKGLVPKIAQTGADENERNKLTIEYTDYVRKLQ